MCSAMGQQALVIEAIQAGARDFVVKPFQPSACSRRCSACSARQNGSPPVPDLYVCSGDAGARPAAAPQPAGAGGGRGTEMRGGGGVPCGAHAEGAIGRHGLSDGGRPGPPLEDRLDGIRSGELDADAALIDALLAAADELEDEIAAAIRVGPSMEQETGSVAASAVTDVRQAPTPPDAESIAHVRLRPDTPIRSARAMLIMRSLEGMAGVIGSDPGEFDDSFDGSLRIFLAASADAAAVEAAIRAAGDVESVDMQAPAVARAAPATDAPAGQTRQVRVDAGRLDGLADGLGELSVLYARLRKTDVPVDAGDTVDRLGTVLGELDHEMRALRMVPVREVFERLPRVVRDAARSVGRDVELLLEGDDVELDRSILDEIGEPLVHLLRNAVDHGIESGEERRAAGKPVRGRIRVSAERERGSVRIVIEDDGRGVSAARMADKARAAGLYDRVAPPGTDEELFRLMSMPGLSTADAVSSMSGRGVGMDVVVNRVRGAGRCHRHALRARSRARSHPAADHAGTRAGAACARRRGGLRHSADARDGGEWSRPASEAGTRRRGAPGCGVVRERTVPLVRLRAVAARDRYGSGTGRGRYEAAAGARPSPSTNWSGGSRSW
jgi:signal transduction histidine kinase